ncbi:hypothetical protein HGRIS_004920 [Hohenbuehelia grisea]|uniref:Uncharacterized protein n=1 Tax=Hohenbuehelia grisea TaxID=104357 RepID=A0ABR3JDF2_9AGAR
MDLIDLPPYRDSSNSPPSSPCQIYDSSSPSSPGLRDELDIWEPSAVMDPMAGSAKATRLPPLYEKRDAHPDGPPAKKARRVYSVESVASELTNADLVSDSERGKTLSIAQHGVVRSFEEDPADALWENAVDRVITQSHGTITLDGQNISRIPDKPMEDLAGFFVPACKDEASNTKYRPPAELLPPPGGRLFTRVTTAPSGSADGLFLRNSSERTRTASDLFGLPRDEIHIFLSRNNVQLLPLKLFILRKLTVLILRANQLTHIPPEIAHLHNLRELNIAGNQLRYVPAEMMKMSLQNLCLHPNPFMPLPEPPARPFGRTKTTPWGWRASLARAEQEREDLSNKRITTPPVHRLPHVLPLFELCLRRALHLFSTPSPLPPISPYEMQYLPPHIRDLLAACGLGSSPSDPEPPPRDAHPSTSTRRVVSTTGPIASFPGAPSAFEREDDARITGAAVCPSPRHRDQDNAVFVMHAEERFTWENVVAGVNVGGAVPVRWRGCQWGCLDFLDEASDVVGAGGAGPSDNNAPSRAPGAGAVAGGDAPAEGDVLMDELELVDDDEAVQVLDIGGQGSLGLSDFED